MRGLEATASARRRRTFPQAVPGLHGLKAETMEPGRTSNMNSCPTDSVLGNFQKEADRQVSFEVNVRFCHTLIQILRQASS